VKILIAEPEDFSKEAIELLSTVGTVTSLTTSQDMIGRALLEYDIIWIRLGLTIRAADIPEQPRCKFIIRSYKKKFIPFVYYRFCKCQPKIIDIKSTVTDNRYLFHH